MGCGGANIAKTSLTKAMNCTSFRSSLRACSACHWWIRHVSGGKVRAGADGPEMEGG